MTDIRKTYLVTQRMLVNSDLSLVAFFANRRHFLSIEHALVNSRVFGIDNHRFDLLPGCLEQRGNDELQGSQGGEGER